MKPSRIESEYLDCQTPLFRAAELEQKMDQMRTVIAVLLVTTIVGWALAFVVVMMGSRGEVI